MQCRYVPQILMFAAVLSLEGRQLGSGGGGTTIYLLVGVRPHLVRLARVLVAQVRVSMCGR